MSTPINKRACPHTKGNYEYMTHHDIHIEAPCEDCGEVGEDNWMCLKCKKVFCSKSGNEFGHLLDHFTDTQHPLAISLHHTGVKCFRCDRLVRNEALVSAVDAVVQAKQFHDPNSSSHDLGRSNNQEVAVMMSALGIGGEKPNKPDDRLLESLDIKGIAKFILSGKAKKIIFATGAGISVSAGIPDFRTPGTGLYYKVEKYNLPNPSSVFDIHYFRKSPKAFYSLSKELWPGRFKPTLTHYFVRLLNEKGRLLRDYTQNIDYLERLAGVPEDKLVEAHGTFSKAHCTGCGQEYLLQTFKAAVFDDSVGYCTFCGKPWKPDIVFFHEDLNRRFYSLFRADFAACDLLIVMGTSLLVQPFASLVSLVGPQVPRLLINRERVGGGGGLYAQLLGGPQFKFDDEDNTRDVECIADCDVGILELSEELGFREELLALSKSSNRALTHDPIYMVPPEPEDPRMADGLQAVFLPGRLLIPESFRVKTRGELRGNKAFCLVGARYTDAADSEGAADETKQEDWAAGGGETWVEGTLAYCNAEQIALLKRIHLQYEAITVEVALDGDTVTATAFQANRAWFDLLDTADEGVLRTSEGVCMWTGDSRPYGGNWAMYCQGYLKNARGDVKFSCCPETYTLEPAWRKTIFRRPDRLVLFDCVSVETLDMEDKVAAVSKDLLLISAGNAYYTVGRHTQTRSAVIAKTTRDSHILLDSLSRLTSIKNVQKICEIEFKPT